MSVTVCSLFDVLCIEGVIFGPLPSPTLIDPSGIQIGGRSNTPIADDDDSKEPLIFKPGIKRGHLPGPHKYYNLYVGEGYDDGKAGLAYEKLFQTPGVREALHGIEQTATRFHFHYMNNDYGPVRQLVIRLFAAKPSCTLLGFNIVNDTAIYINVTALLGDKENDQRPIVAGLVSTAMHELAHACTPHHSHDRVWSVAQSLANQQFFEVCQRTGLLQQIWHPDPHRHRRSSF